MDCSQSRSWPPLLIVRVVEAQRFPKKVKVFDLPFEFRLRYTHREIASRASGYFQTSFEDQIVKHLQHQTTGSRTAIRGLLACARPEQGLGAFTSRDQAYDWSMPSVFSKQIPNGINFENSFSPVGGGA